MAVSTEALPPGKRKPSAESFMSPAFSDHKLVQSLLLLSLEISSLQPLQPLLKRNSSSIIRKIKLLSIFFEELLRNPVRYFPPSALLCFEELHIVLQRIKTLIEDCSCGSKIWLLMQIETVSNTFQELTADLSTLLDILPAREFSLSDDIVELIVLIRKQCYSRKPFLDPADQAMRNEVVKMLNKIKREIVPDHSKLAEIFDRLRLHDSRSCGDEIEKLEDEVQNQPNKKLKADVISLIGLVRYAKCVLYGASTPRSTRGEPKSAVDVSVPADFRCPISLDVMKDPVVVSTGQTYDSASISMWIQSGHNTCPKTGQPLVHTRLIPNRALKNLIAMWCREHRIPFDTAETNEKSNGVVMNKTALEATRMTVTFLVNKLTASQSTEAANRMVHELRVLAKTDSDSRACIAEAGSLPLLVKFLRSEHSNLQVNAVTTILNLSILEANKARIMETEGVLNGIIEVLRSGVTWEAKANSAATIFSLTSVHGYRKKLGRKTRVVKGLLDLAKSGPTTSKKDALVAILNLAGDRETVGKLIEGGVVEVINEVMGELPNEAVAILELVVKKGGLAAVAATYPLIQKLASILRSGTDQAQERVVATLVNVCRKGGSHMVMELAGISGIERAIWEVMGMGTGRAKRKAATLLRILQRWAVGIASDAISEHPNLDIPTNRMVLPG